MTKTSGDAIPSHCPEQRMKGTRLLGEKVPCRVMGSGRLWNLTVRALHHSGSVLIDMVSLTESVPKPWEASKTRLWPVEKKPFYSKRGKKNMILRITHGLHGVNKVWKADGILTVCLSVSYCQQQRLLRGH